MIISHLTKRIIKVKNKGQSTVLLQMDSNTFIHKIVKWLTEVEHSPKFNQITFFFKFFVLVDN